jgi:hypothetical protein
MRLAHAYEYENKEDLVMVVEAGASSAGERRPCIHATNQKSAFAPTGRHRAASLPLQ